MIALPHGTKALGMVAEGVPNTLSIYEAARKAGVRTPIIDATYCMLYENKPAGEAMAMSIPALAAPNISEWAMLLPSPM